LRKHRSFAEQRHKITLGSDERLKWMGDKLEYRACPAYPETSGMPASASQDLSTRIGMA